MQYGFIQQNVLSTGEWYIIDKTGLVYHKGNVSDAVFNELVPLGDCLPDYWVEHCLYWYDSIEKLIEEHSTEML